MMPDSQPVLSRVHDVISSNAQPLPYDLRLVLEERFGCDFAHVQIHHGSAAAESARELSALAYQVGNHIVFAAGTYQPWSNFGFLLLAHELAHLVQCSNHPIAGQELALGDPDSLLELEARLASQRVYLGYTSRPLYVHCDANVIRRFPCPGPPLWKSISAGPKEIYEPANSAIEQAYTKDKASHASAILFGSQFVTGRDIQLPKGAPNKAYGNALLSELRGIWAQNRPDIIDFEERVFYEIKTELTAKLTPGKVKDQLLDYYRKAETIRIKYGERQWSELYASWKPPHVLSLPGDVANKFVCTAATDYSRWPSGLILYDVREKDRELENRLRELEDAYQRLLNQYSLYSEEHKAQLHLYNSNFAGFWTNRIFNTVPPEITVWLNAYSRLLAVRRYLNEMDVVRASAQLGIAKLWYLYALKRYTVWKNGIEPAAKNMYIAITATAIVLILAAVGGYVAAAGAAVPAAEAASTAQTLYRIGALCERAEQAIAAANEEMRMLEAIEEAEREASQLLFR